MQPSCGSHTLVVHSPPSLHERGAPAVQTPAWQVSAPLQRFPSGHGVASATAACWQPALESHVSAVHGLPSSQAKVNTQPVAGSQESPVHAFPSSQTSGVPGVHVPAWHVSVPLQKLPSGHGVPSARSVCWQPVAGVQVSRVHGLPSSHGPGAVMTLRASSRPPDGGPSASGGRVGRGQRRRGGAPLRGGPRPHDRRKLRR